METAREIRPRRRRMLTLIGTMILGGWILLGGVAIYEAIRTWEEVRTAVLGAFGVSCVFGVICLLQWRSDRRTMWRVDDTGIAVHRGSTVRLVGWCEITSLRVMAFGAVLRTRAKPREERLYWLTIADGEWLHEAV